MKEVWDEARDIIPTNEILGDFVREGVLKGEGWRIEVILRINIDNDTKDGRSS